MRRAVMFAGLSGLFWGATVFAMPRLPQTDAMALVIACAVMACGASTTLAGIRSAALTYVLACILPYTGYFLSQGGNDQAYLLLGFLSLVLIVGMLWASRSVHGTFIEDVSARIQTDRALQDLKGSRDDWLEVAATTDAFGLFDNLGNLRFWNATFEHWFAAAAVAAGVSLDRLLAALLPSDSNEHAANGDARISRYREHRRASDQPIVERLADGRWLSSEMRPTKRGYTVWILRDMTEQHVRDAEKTHLRNQAIEARQLQTIGQFSGGVAHDFNNMLAAIRTFAELIQMSVETATGDIGASAKRIIGACDRGAEMVRNILQFATVMHVEKTVFPFSGVFEQAVGLLNRRNQPNAHILAENRAGSVMIEANESKIVQLILNLGINACGAVSTFGGVVNLSASVTKDSRAIGNVNDRLSAYQGQPVVIADSAVMFGFGSLPPDRPCIVIEVSDTGTGIDPESITRIFEPFVSTKETTMRTGFGLAVVKSVVLATHGAIEVRSRSGQGTIFWVWLPISDQTAIQPKDSVVVETSGRERVLVVDDDVDVADGITLALNSLGYRAKSLNNPIRALEVISAAPKNWDVIVVDHAMPAMTGDTLAQAIKRVRPDIPILMYTGLAAEGLEVSARDAGILAVLRKPVDAKRISAEIRRALTRVH